MAIPDKLEINVSEAKVYHMPTDTSAQEETMEGTPQAISHSAGPPTVDDTSMIAANGFGAVDVPAHAPVPPASGTAHAGPSGEAFTNGNGQSAKNKRTVVINLADTGNPADDTYLLRSAVELLMEYPGQDAVHLEISNNGQRTTLEMPLVTTSFCPELEKQLASLVGHGRARLVS